LNYFNIVNNTVLRHGILSMKKLRKYIKVYVRLTRWEDYTTFIQFIAGYLIVKNFALQEIDFYRITKVLLILAPLLYGGIYALNDYIDAGLDKKHKIKKERPIPNGEIKRSSALILSIALIFLALTVSIYDPLVLLMILSFLIVNVFYMFIAKKIPYLEILVNSLPHLMRFYFGFVLAGGAIDLISSAIYLIGVSNNSLFKRIRELEVYGPSVRPVLLYYSLGGLKKLFFLVIFIVCILTINFTGLPQIIGLCWIITNLLVYFADRNKTYRKLIDFAWR